MIKVPGNGPSNARVMVVGEAPGRNEEIERMPFVGAAGQLLRDRLRATGISPEQTYFTNLCKYRPPGNELLAFHDKSGMPNELMMEGLMELREEIQSIKPTVILACGNYPLQWLTGKGRWARNTGYSGISDWRGSIIPGNGPAAGIKVVASFHPAAILRKYSWLAIFDLDLRRLKEQSAFPEIIPVNKKASINPEGEDREWWRQRLLDTGDIITFDIEQLGPDLLSIGFCVDTENAVAIRTRSEADIQWCRDILLSGKPLCAQNGMFDCSMLEYWHHFPGLLGHLKHDTLLASHSAYIELPKDLGFLCSVYTEHPCYWDKIDWKRVRANKEIADTDQFLEYNATDAWVTHQVMLAQQADELQDPKVRKTFEFEMSLLEPLWDMSLRGMRVDADQMKFIKMQAEAAISEFSQKLEGIAGRSINVMSSHQVGKLLYTDLGLPVLKAGKTGPSADDKTLAALELKANHQSQKDAVNFIRQIRKNRSLISKFVEIEYDADGRMRCHYNPAGTVTGRLSSRKFYPTQTGANLQNIPRDKRVRRVFIPDPGHLFFYNDLERAESLVVAHLTGDPTMLADHAPDVDAHKRLAVRLFEKPEDEITEEERYMGKQTRHAGNYMEGWKTFMANVNKLASVTGVSIDAKQAKYFIQRYRDLHPYLPAWWRAVEAEIRKPARTLYNLLDRPRKFFDRIDSTLPTAVAFIPQSTVGDVLNVGLLRCYRDEELRQLGVQNLVQVHDAIGGQVPERNVEPAMRRMRELMVVQLPKPRSDETFTIPVEINVGPNWGEVKKLELT